jgi:hypothetical protein
LHDDLISEDDDSEFSSSTTSSESTDNEQPLEVMQTDDGGEVSAADSCTSTLGFQLPVPITSGQHISTDSTVTILPATATSATNSSDPLTSFCINRRDTNRTLFELRGEVLATLDANVATGKLAYSRHSDNLFVIQHKYVTLVLELCPIVGSSMPPLGRMLFRQIGGDVHCYGLLCNELSARILLD